MEGNGLIKSNIAVLDPTKVEQPITIFVEVESEKFAYRREPAQVPGVLLLFEKLRQDGFTD